MEFLNLLANFAPPIGQQRAELCLTDPPLCREGFSEKDILKLFRVRGTKADKDLYLPELQGLLLLPLFCRDHS